MSISKFAVLMLASGVMCSFPTSHAVADEGLRECLVVNDAAEVILKFAVPSGQPCDKSAATAALATPASKKYRSESKTATDLSKPETTVISETKGNWSQTAPLPNDTLFPAQWGLNNTQAQQFDLNAPEFWTALIKRRVQDTVVAVFDTGVRYDNIDLLPNLWTNENEIPFNQIDDDRNGYVDDVVGYDVNAGTGDPLDCPQFSHGTSVIGSGFAATNNGSNGSGIASSIVGNKIRALPIKIAACNAPPTLSGTLLAVERVAALKQKGIPIRVVNMSYTLDASANTPVLRQAMDRLRTLDIVVVAGAGNDFGNIGAAPGYFFPHSWRPLYGNLVLVGNITQAGQRHPRSNYGTGAYGIDLLAPAGGIPIIPLSGSSIGTGTSFGAPMVSAIFGWYFGLHPQSSAGDAVQKVLSASPSIPHLTSVVNGGRIASLLAAID